MNLTLFFVPIKQTTKLLQKIDRLESLDIKNVFVLCCYASVASNRD